MEPTTRLKLDDHTRDELWLYVMDAIENYLKNVSSAPVAPDLDVKQIRSLLKPLNFEQTLEPLAALEFVIQGLWKYQVHTPHPRYFGLFNPAPTTMSVVADTLVATFNPQLAAWSHSPLANEIERHLVRAFGARFGYDPAQADGTFATGGAEANHTALLTALVQKFPQFARTGLRGLEAQPVFYVSNQSHHSFIKAARLSGLGTDAVRQIRVNEAAQMDTEHLASQIAVDRSQNLAPFMVVATAGTTNAGVIDLIAGIADIAADEELWFHVDAAWGGAAVLVPELRGLLDGIERADSITFDAHKWLSVPMAAGLYLTRHTEILDRTCRIATEYMPRDAAGMDVIDPYVHSMQWSRRFIGLKVFLSLAVAGWAGYERSIRHQVAMGKLLRRELEASHWKVVNQTELPVICIVDQENPDGDSHAFLDGVAREVVTSGKAWISTTHLGPDRPVLRACITNYRTDAEDILALVHALNEARQRLLLK